MVERRGHANREGTWQSPGYRSGRIRARVTLALFALTALALLVEIGVAVEALQLIDQLEAGDLPAPGAIEALVARADQGASFAVLSAIGLGIAFLGWLSRTVEITPALGGGTPRASPAWSIIWWFVPVAFLWKPYTVVREVWERLATPERSGGGALIVGWWLAWIGALVASRSADFASRPLTFGARFDWEAARVAELLELGSLILFLLAAGLGFLVVRELQARAELRAQLLGFEPASPGALRGAVSTSSWTPFASSPGNALQIESPRADRDRVSDGTRGGEVPSLISRPLVRRTAVP